MGEPNGGHNWGRKWGKFNLLVLKVTKSSDNCNDNGSNNGSDNVAITDTLSSSKK